MSAPAGAGRDPLKILAELITIAIIAAPLLPDARTRWWCLMRIAQNLAANIGLVAIAAEHKYRQECA